MPKRIVWVVGLSLLANAILVAVVFALVVNGQEQNQVESEGEAALFSAASLPEATNTPLPTQPRPATAVPTVAAIPSITPTPVPTAIPPSPTPPPTEPLPTATLLPTATTLPTDTPTPLPPSPTPLPDPHWLAYLNQFREQAGLSPLQEDLTLTSGTEWHSSYMVVLNEPIAHSEDPASALYADNGDTAAQHGNIFSTDANQGTRDWAINFWISAPFHAVPIFDPQLTAVGYGEFAQTNNLLAEGGEVGMAAVLDVLSGLQNEPADVAYPIMFPKDGGQTWVVRFTMYEWPESLASCPGYQLPTGPPIILQIGNGDLTTRATSYTLWQGDEAIPSCAFDESSFHHPDPFQQQTGRTILGERDAIVLMPRSPLQVGQHYTVLIEANGQAYTWSFDAVSRPAEQ